MGRGSSSPAVATKPARRWRKNCAGSAPRPSSCRADVRHEDDVRGLVDQTVARFGRLDVAVNNAGTEGQPGPVTDQTAETYAATFDTNVLGTLLSMKHELRVMIGQGHGSIINLSSTMGHKGAAGRVGLHRQQACGRGADEGGGARRGGVRRARQCRRARARWRPGCWTGSPAPPAARPA